MSLQNGRWMFFLLAAVFFWAMPTSANEVPRDFTLALSWQPAFCELSARKPECRAQSADRWDAQHLALHGLWPNVDRDGNGRIDGEDNYCLPEPQRKVAIRSDWRDLAKVALPSALREDLDRVMPGAVSQLERHQWVKHGTCSGLDQTSYFQVAIARTDDLAASGFSKFVSASIDREIARRDLLASFEADFGRGSAKALRLICDRKDGVVLLSEIRLLLRTESLNQKLGRTSLAIPAKAPGGSCPARFRIDAAG
jgi:ribonuclease T2